MSEPADRPAGAPRDAAADALEESARVRRSIVETIARVRKLTAGIGVAHEPREAGDPPSPPPAAAVEPLPEKHEEEGSERLSGDVAALIERTRRVIDSTRRLLDKSRRESAERKGE